MKKPLLFAALTAAVLISSITINSCSKDVAHVSNKANVEFRLTDGPCDYDHLYIDVQGIEIHSDSNGWESLAPFNQGIYDVLELTNGLDTLLCKVDLPAGEISQIRLILGENNSLETGGNSYELKVPSGQQSGIKLNLHKELLANTSYTVWLDFDACKSIVVKGNGAYSMKPVIRAYSDSTNGKLSGWVLPDTISPVVHVIENTDTLTAIPNSDGYFLVCGLDGTYDIYITPGDPNYSDTLIQTIQVGFGELVTMDTVHMQ